MRAASRNFPDVWSALPHASVGACPGAPIDGDRAPRKEQILLGALGLLGLRDRRRLDAASQWRSAELRSSRQDVRQGGVRGSPAAIVGGIEE